MRNVKEYRKTFIDNFINFNIFRVLMYNSNNTAANEIIQRVQYRALKNDKFKNVIIIRMHSVNTKTQIMHYKARNDEKIEKIMIISIFEMIEMTKFKIALMIHEMNQKIQKIRHEIKNRKYQFYKINLFI